MNTIKFLGLVVLVSLTSQVGFAQKNSKLTREVLFTLDANERIYFNEYCVATNFSNKKFVAVVENTLTHEHTLVHNGKRIVKTKGDYSSVYEKYPFGIFYFDVEKENGLGYTYELAGRRFVNIEGKVLSKVNGEVSNFMIYGTKKFAFLYRKIEDTYTSVYIDGRIFGPHKWVSAFTVTDKGSFMYYYKLTTDNYYININGEIFGPYNSINNAYMNKNGSYIYSYSIKNNNTYSYYVNVNGTNIESNDKRIFDAHVFDNGGYIYGYHDNFKQYINLNGKISGPYDASYAQPYLHIKFANDSYIITHKIDGNYYVDVDEVRFGPFAEVDYLGHNGVQIAKDKKYAFRYTDTNGKQRYCVNGNLNASMDEFDFFSSNIETDHLANNLNFIHYGYNMFDNTITIEDMFDNTINITSPDNTHSFYSDFAYEYVVIDGEPVGKSPALYCWYNDKTHAFVWNSIEGKELVIYEYKLDK
jgi:hypothetical protein